MTTIREINEQSYKTLKNFITDHIKNGNNSEFEIHLDSTGGSLYYSVKLLEFIDQNNVKLKIYSTGNISDGGVLLIFGCTNNIAKPCIRLYTTNIQIDNYTFQNYLKLCKHKTALSFAMKGLLAVIPSKNWYKSGKLIDNQYLFHMKVINYLSKGCECDNDFFRQMGYKNN